MRRLALGLLLFCAWAPFDARAGSNYVPAPSAAGQPESDILTSLADITCVADVLPYCSGANTINETTMTAFSRTLLDDVNAAAWQATLGVTSAEVVPDYVAIGADTFDLADWADALAAGGPDSVDEELGGSGATLVMPLNRKADGTGITGTRAQGLLTGIAAGDFTVGFALAYQAGVGFATAQGIGIYCGPVFVDGTDVSTSDWYSVATYWAEVSVASGATLYAFDNVGGGGNQFATHTSFATVANAMQPGQTGMTAWLVRSGVTLQAYFGRYGEIPTKVGNSWTVTAGAGLIGLRCQIFSVTAEDVVSLHVMRYRYIASATPPWIL